MATHSSVLAQRIPWTEEPGGLQSMGSQKSCDFHFTSLDLLTWILLFGLQLFKAFCQNVTAAFSLENYFTPAILPTESESVTHSVMSDSLRLHGLQPTRLFCPWNFPAKNTRVGCHVLLQGIFLTQGQNPGLPHCRQILYYLSHTSKQSILLLPYNIFPSYS